MPFYIFSLKNFWSNRHLVLINEISVVTLDIDLSGISHLSRKKTIIIYTVHLCFTKFIRIFINRNFVVYKKVKHNRINSSDSQAVKNEGCIKTFILIHPLDLL